MSYYFLDSSRYVQNYIGPGASLFLGQLFSYLCNSSYSIKTVFQTKKALFDNGLERFMIFVLKIKIFFNIKQFAFFILSLKTLIMHVRNLFGFQI